MADLKRRPLAPFERRLCQELGCTEEEYSLFLNEMHSRMARKPIPADAIRCDPLTVSIVNAVVGVLFQVVGLLLRPQPRNQSTTQGPLGETAAPVFGFSSVQDLARIGEIIPQVYCDRTANPKGGVRVNTKLVWSQIESRGNAQEGKFLGILSYAALGSIDLSGVAVGNAQLNTLNSTASWLYYISENKDAPLLQNSTIQYLQANSDNQVADPTTEGGYPVYWVPKGTTRVPGTSQAYTPNTSNTFGITSVVPVGNSITVLTTESNGNETVDRALTGINFDADTIAAIRAGRSAGGINTAILSLVVSQRVTNPDPNVSGRGSSSASSLRENVVQSFSPGQKYILGNTVWRAEPFSPGQNTTLDNGAVVLRYRLIETFGDARYSSETVYRDTLTVNSSGYRDREDMTLCPLFRYFCGADFASYTTLSKVDSLEFSIKANVWGEQNSPYRNEIQFNGSRGRIAAFKVRFRRAGTTSFTGISPLFYIDRSSKTSTFFYIRLEFPTRDNWEVQIRPVVDIPLAPQVGTFKIDINQPAVSVPVSDGITKCYANGTLRGPIEGADVFGPSTWRKCRPYSVNQDGTYSFTSGPEFTIIAANEIQYDPKQETDYYKFCSLIGLNIFGGSARQDITQISAFVNRGRKIDRIDLNANNAVVKSFDSTNRFGDIFLNTLVGRNAGLGQYVSEDMVDLESIALANRFTGRNGFYFDGVIDQETPWRQWATETSGHNLLQVVTKNGKFGLVPVVPYNQSTGAIDPQGYTIRALFNEANILEGSYSESVQAAEDTLPQLVTIRYRENLFNSPVDSGFSRERSVTYKLKGEGTDLDREVVVNCVGDVTSDTQARTLATYLLCARRYEDRVITFKTPEPWLGLAPNDIIRVDTQFTRFSSTFAGSIAADGSYDIIGFTQMPANATVLVYTPGSGTGIQTFSGDTFNPKSYPFSIVAIGTNTSESRLFTITKIDIDEDGIAEISAKLFPVLTASGATRPSLIASALLNPSDYVEQVGGNG